MAYVRPQGPKAALNTSQRRKMVALVLDQWWTVEAAARRDSMTARFVRGDLRTPRQRRYAQRVIRLRLQRRWGR